jgi:hypothetical protein
MPQYLFLLHEDPSRYAELSPAEMQAIIEKYSAWAGKIAAQGRLRGGEKLQDGTGRRVHTVNGKLTVTDGPYAEGKEVVGGYFIVEADNFEQAVELASDGPHVEHGVVEVREIEPTNA